MLEPTEKPDALNAAVGGEKGHLLLQRERVAAARAWPDGEGRGLFPQRSSQPSQHGAQLQLLAQRKWLLAVAHSCFPCSVCCFQFNVLGSWIEAMQRERCRAFPCKACLEENPSLMLGMAAGTAAPPSLARPSHSGKTTHRNLGWPLQ